MNPDQRFIFNAQTRGVGRVDLRIARLIRQRRQRGTVPGHRATRVVADFTHRRQHHWVLFGEFVDRRDPVAGEELRQTVRGVEFLFEEIRRPLIGIRRVAARPLNEAQLAHLLVSRPIEIRAQMTQLIPDLLGVVVVHRVAHTGGDFTDDLPVRFQIPLRFNGFKEALETTVSSGKHPFMLAPRRRR